MFEMHDWTLRSIQYSWEEAQARFVFKTHASERVLVAKEVIDLQVPQRNSWGPSVSVNRVNGPITAKDGKKQLTIEMQSGDLISLIATDFELEAT